MSIVYMIHKSFNQATYPKFLVAKLIIWPRLGLIESLPTFTLLIQMKPSECARLFCVTIQN